MFAKPSGKTEGFIFYIWNMERVILLCILISTYTQVLAQKQFEGIVTYQITNEKNEALAKYRLYYGNSKIKGELIEAADTTFSRESNEVIIDLTTGFIHEVSTKTKIIVTKNLKPDKTINLIPSVKLNKILLNQRMNAYVEPISFSANSKKDTTPTVYWYGDSLFYTIPAAYIDRSMSHIGNGKLVFLSSKECMGEGAIGYNHFITAISIQRKNIADSIFKLPAGYTMQNQEHYPAKTDDVNVEIKEINITELKSEPPPPPPPPSNPKTKTTKKVPKSTASKPKQ